MPHFIIFIRYWRITLPLLVYFLMVCLLTGLAVVLVKDLLVSRRLRVGWPKQRWAQVLVLLVVMGSAAEPFLDAVGINGDPHQLPLGSGMITTFMWLGLFLVSGSPEHPARLNTMASLGLLLLLLLVFAGDLRNLLVLPVALYAWYQTLMSHRRFKGKTITGAG